MLAHSHQHDIQTSSYRGKNPAYLETNTVQPSAKETATQNTATEAAGNGKKLQSPLMKEQMNAMSGNLVGTSTIGQSLGIPASVPSMATTKEELKQKYELERQALKLQSELEIAAIKAEAKMLKIIAMNEDGGEWTADNDFELQQEYKMEKKKLKVIQELKEKALKMHYDLLKLHLKDQGTYYAGQNLGYASPYGQNYAGFASQYGGMPSYGMSTQGMPSYGAMPGSYTPSPMSFMPYVAYMIGYMPYPGTPFPYQMQHQFSPYKQPMQHPAMPLPYQYAMQQQYANQFSPGFQPQAQQAYLQPGYQSYQQTGGYQSYQTNGAQQLGGNLQQVQIPPGSMGYEPQFHDMEVLKQRFSQGSGFLPPVPESKIPANTPKYGADTKTVYVPDYQLDSD